MRGTFFIGAKMKKQLVALTLMAFIPTVNAMQQNPNVDALSQNVTSLWRAVNNSGKNVDAANLKAIQDLLNQGANPNIELSSSSPLELAFIRLSQRGLDPVEAQRRLEVVRILLSKGAELKGKRYNLVTLVSNMQETPHKQELLKLLKSRGLVK